MNFSFYANSVFKLILVLLIILFNKNYCSFTVNLLLT